MLPKLALCLLPLAGCAAELVPAAIEAGGLTRTYRYYAPPGVEKRPLIFVLHGAGGTAQSLSNSLHIETLAAEKQFIVVYPDGFEKHWNDLRGIPEWTAHTRNVDDIAFFSALIDRFIAGHHADPKRVFVTGISNGGLMSHRIGCELAGKVAAIAPVVRTFTVKLSEGCKPARPLPVMMFFGTADKLVPFEGGMQKMGSIETPVLSAQQTIDRWVALDGCTGKPPALRPTQVYSACRGGAQVVAHIREGAGHSWPKDATPLILEFFARHPMP